MSTQSEIALAIVAAFCVLGLLSLMSAYLIIGMAWDKSPLRSQAASRKRAIAGWPLIWRALLLRCPNCGKGPIFKATFSMNDCCPVCDAVFWKNEGEWLGPAVV